MVIPTIPVAGMALILGIDRFLSMCRAVVNMIGNAVATLVIARWENELDRTALVHHLRGTNNGLENAIVPGSVAK
jgi:aerobic C4-dicarboxylate transport protein